MRLKNVGLRFRGKYQLVGGQHFYGQLLDIPDTSRVSNFFSTRRYLRVNITEQLGYKIFTIPGGSFNNDFDDSFGSQQPSSQVRRQLIIPSDVIIADGVKYIVAEHGTGFFHDPIYKHFKLFSVDLEKTWYTRVGVTNPITGVMEKASDVDAGTIYISVQPKSLIEDSISIQTPQHTIITNAAVNVDDKIGDDWVVTRVDPQLGVYVAEVKEG